MSTETKVKRLVGQVIPKGKPFKGLWDPAGFGKYHVLRVVTPAWRTLPRFERILKVQSAVFDGLAPKEQEHILRVSVLTAEEYKRFFRGIALKGLRRRLTRHHSPNGR